MSSFSFSIGHRPISAVKLCLEDSADVGKICYSGGLIADHETVDPGTEVQAGDGRHLFAPMSFLDDTWFHRSYWVYGRSFAGGHNGYYQAGKYAPAGRLIVFNKDKVYGFGRDPEFFAFYRSMQAYAKSLQGEGTTLVLQPDSEFFEFFGSESGKSAPAAGQPASGQ